MGYSELRATKLLLTWCFGLSVASSLQAQEPAVSWPFAPEALRPIWLSTTMYGESLLFVQDTPDDQPRAALLFQPTRVLSVRNPTGDVTYQEGRDYVWKPGTRQIVLPAGSSISFQRPQDLRRPAKSQRHALTHRDGDGEILFGAQHEYHDMQMAVSYEYDPNTWAGPRPSFAEKQLPRTIQRLQAKQPLVIALLGDSISTGCNASGWAKVAPNQPPYQDLLVLKLQDAYGAEIRLDNFAVGGTDTAWGMANIGKVIESQADLVILAFGMNDAARRPAPEYQANIRTIIEDILRARPQTEFILVASMLGNRDWTALQHSLFPQYRDALVELCRPGVALADMTSLWTELLKHKLDRDLTGNGVNHPNDFGHRLYAQVLSALLIPTSPDRH